MEGTSKVKKLILMTRHGQRSPLIISSAEKYWKGPAASLTSKGADTMNARGAALRSRFDAFFREKGVGKDSIRVYSSNLHRTVFSAYYFVHGMMKEAATSEPMASETEGLTYLGQYKFARKPMRCDLLLRYINTGISRTITENCNAQNEKYKAAKLEFEAVKQVLLMLPAGQQMTLDTLNYVKLFYFYDYLSTYVYHGLPLPGGFPQDRYQSIAFTDKLLFEILFGAPANVRLANYMVAKEIQQILADDSCSVALISGHDLNISSFLRLFGFIPKSIPFGAYWLLVEYENGRIEIEYCGESEERVYGAGSPAELEKFMAKNTYENDKEYLEELKCMMDEDIIKAYRESPAKEIEKELTI